MHIDIAIKILKLIVRLRASAPRLIFTYFTLIIITTTECCHFSNMHVYIFFLTPFCTVSVL